VTLNHAACLAGWPTPVVNDSSSTRNATANRSPGQKHHAGTTLTDAVDLASWPSPKASNTTGAGTRGDGGDNLQTVASWATPTVRDHKDGASDGTAPVNGLLGRQTWLAAEMASGGQLNPELSRWLQGYPAEWGSCGATAMQSCRKSPRRS
jgi:hypothetical protein